MNAKAIALGLVAAVSVAAAAYLWTQGHEEGPGWLILIAFICVVSI